MSNYKLSDDALRLILASGEVKRYHTFRTIGEQNNADHSWNVTVLLLAIFPDASRDLIIASIMHDAHELKTGDIPSTTKWEYPELRAIIKRIEADIEETYQFMPPISEQEKAILKVADCLEMIRFAAIQLSLGNRNARKVLVNCYNHVYTLDLPNYMLDRFEHVYTLIKGDEPFPEE